MEELWEKVLVQIRSQSSLPTLELSAYLSIYRAIYVSHQLFFLIVTMI